MDLCIDQIIRELLCSRQPLYLTILYNRISTNSTVTFN